MATNVVGIGECCVSGKAEDVLVTHALGSCIAVLISDTVAGVGGLLHFMLPESGGGGGKPITRPHVFADTGIPLLFKAAYQLGAVKARLAVMVTGGAQMMDPNGTFNIGKRNHAAIRKIFWQAGVIVHKEEVGGTASRTVRLDVATGRVVLRTAGDAAQEVTFNLSRQGASNGV